MMTQTQTTSNLMAFDEAQRLWSARHRTLGGRNLPCCDVDGVLTKGGQIIEGIWMEYDNAKPVLLYDLHDDADDRFARRHAMSDLAGRVGIPAVTIVMRRTDQLDSEGDTTWAYRILARNDAALRWTDDDGAKNLTEAELIEWLYALRGRDPDIDLAGIASERNDWRDDRLSAMFRALEAAMPARAGFSREDKDRVAAILEAKKSPGRLYEGAASTRALRSVANAAEAAFMALEYTHFEEVPADENTRGSREMWYYANKGGRLDVREMAARLVPVASMQQEPAANLADFSNDSSPYPLPLQRLWQAYPCRA